MGSNTVPSWCSVGLSSVPDFQDCIISRGKKPGIPKIEKLIKPIFRNANSFQELMGRSREPSYASF